jgi:hypothetical protein
MGSFFKAVICYSINVFSLHSFLYAQHAPVVLEQFLRGKDFKSGFQYKYNSDTLSDFYYPTMVNSVKHIYLWQKNKIAIQLDGTGKLLQFDSNFNLARLDSTIYEGYNYGAYNFVYNDTIFSLGGYGFWAFNGMLRYFNDNSKSWGIINANKIIPLRLWYNAQVIPDFENKKLYVLYAKPKEEWHKENASSDENAYLQCLDLVSKKWWEEDKILNNESIAGWSWAYKPICNTRFGLLAFKFEELEVYDPMNNRVGVVNKSKAKELQDNWYQNTQLIMFYVNNQVVYFEPRTKKLSIFDFNESDIKWTRKKLYYNSTIVIKEDFNKSAIPYYIFAFLIFILGFYSHRLFQSKKTTIISGSIINNSNYTHDDQEALKEKPKSFREILTEVEKSLIDILIKNSSQSKMTSVIQVNEVLGISRKDIKTQNNIRANAFQMINKKFSIYTGLQDELIQKQRTDFDKRFFEYFIHSKFLAKLK